MRNGGEKVREGLGMQGVYAGKVENIGIQPQQFVPGTSNVVQRGAGKLGEDIESNQ